MEEFVLGLPLNMNGTKGMRAERTEEFAHELEEAFPDIPGDSGMKGLQLLWRKRADCCECEQEEAEESY